MKQKMMRLMAKSISALLAVFLAFHVFSMSALATNDEDGRIIVVSLGDSYSSGEGIEPFYGQDEIFADRISNEDWLAHRSQNSWPSMIEIPGLPGTMSDYKVDESYSWECQWYFIASSGAETIHFTTEQNKHVRRKMPFSDPFTYDQSLSPQLDIFDEITGTVDYVTFSIGGNDVGFSDIVEKAAKGSTSLMFKNQALQDAINTALRNIDTYMATLKQTYRAVQQAAGEQAYIIVVGYPKLFDQNGKGVFLSKKEATWINNAVSTFNDELEKTVKECQEEGMRIVFVDVEDVFDGHEAYSDSAWINKIMIFAQEQDLDDSKPSSYSVHPNARGAEAYAQCVNEAIARIEEEKRENEERKNSDISGTITIADADTDMTNNQPLKDARVEIEVTSYMSKEAYSGTDGKYVLTDIPVGTYRLTVSKEGYIPVTEILSVTEDDDDIIYNIAIEAISEENDGIGFASGIIYDAGTGRPVQGLTLKVRSGLNNTTGTVLQTLYTDSYGRYTTLGIEAGNYTIEIVDNRTGITSTERYTTTTINVKVLGDITINNQNGYVSNGLVAGELRVTLSWGYSPSDLDSHMVGPDGNGGRFHEFYRVRADGSDTDLDVDDTSSYGPETITVYREKEGVYIYAVHDYSNRGSSTSTALSNSGAQVEVYRGSQLLKTFYVPNNQGGTLWSVFSYDSTTQKITTINTMSYESSTDDVLSGMPFALSVEERGSSVYDESIEMIVVDIVSTPKE